MLNTCINFCANTLNGFRVMKRTRVKTDKQTHSLIILYIRTELDENILNDFKYRANKISIPRIIKGHYSVKM